MTGQRKLTVHRFGDRYAALGVAVSYLMTKPAFARLGFGHWARVLTGQINRDHYFFVFEGSVVVGFAGWALAGTAEAEDWLAGRPTTPDERGNEATAVVLNAWAAETPAANRRLLEEMRRVGIGRHAVYARREYADGTSRPVKLRIGNALSRHIKSNAATDMAA